MMLLCHYFFVFFLISLNFGHVECFGPIFQVYPRVCFVNIMIMWESELKLYYSLQHTNPSEPPRFFYVSLNTFVL